MVNEKKKTRKHGINGTTEEGTAIWVVSYLLVGIIGGLIGYISFGAIHPAVAQTAPPVPLEESFEWEEYAGKQDKEEDIPSIDIFQRTDHPPMENKEEYVQWMLQHTNEKEKFISWRWDCLQDLLSWHSITDPRVKEAFLRTPRENFIRQRNIHRAYEHAYMPIGYGATITDPWIVSVMTQAINPLPQHKVLEIGTGSGYQSALLSELSNYIYTIEIIEELAMETDELYKKYESEYPNYTNIHRLHGDGYYGWPQKGNFDRIIVTCSIDHIPPPLLHQLEIGGIMVIPVGPPSGQKLLKITKQQVGDQIYFDRENLLPRTVHFIFFRDESGKRYSTGEDEEEPEAQE
ncbi:MAG: protein-L-isoaspartate O-methyltransferase [Spirochaetales bacterium]|nr:protein-L-isoaspartate O-methyltransferase [Spirochaetales bacterium]